MSDPEAWSLFVAGEPAPQAPGTTVVTKAGGRFRAGMSKSLKFWRERVATEAQRCAPSPLLEGPLALGVDFAMPRPKSLPKTKPRSFTKRPDLKNLVWAIEDSLKSIVYHDDSQIVWYEHCRKRYAAIGEAPGCTITLVPLPEGS